VHPKTCKSIAIIILKKGVEEAGWKYTLSKKMSRSYRVDSVVPGIMP